MDSSHWKQTKTSQKQPRSCSSFQSLTGDQPGYSICSNHRSDHWRGKLRIRKSGPVWRIEYYSRRWAIVLIKRRIGRIISHPSRKIWRPNKYRSVSCSMRNWYYSTKRINLITCLPSYRTTSTPWLSTLTIRKLYLSNKYY